MNDTQTPESAGLPVRAETAAVPATTVDLVPRPPEKATPEILENARSSAATLTEKVLAAPDDLQLLSELTRIGENAQSKVNSFFDMRRVTVGEMMNKISDGSHNPLPNQIKQMRGLMEKFDPRPFKEQIQLAQQYGSKGIKNALIRKMRGIPLIGDLLQKVADTFNPISAEVDGLIMAMEGGLARLDEKNAAIMTQADSLKELILEVELKAYEAELIFAELKKHHDAAPEADKQKIMNAMSRVSKRALFLRGNEQIFLQVLTGLRTSITTNFELRDTVSMMRDQASPLLTNLYALVVVQQESRQIAEAASATQEMVTDLLQAGAEMTRDNVEAVGNLGIKMMTQMDKLIESKNTFLEAVAKADQIAEQTVDAATRSIPVLQQASEELRKVVADHEGADALAS